MATNVSLGFQLSASAAGMSQGINAGVVELQKLGQAARKTSTDLATIKTLQISQAFLGGVRSVTSAFQRFTSGATSAIDQTNKLSRGLGISFEQMQQLNLAASLSGASTEQLAQAFRKAQLTIAQAEQGSKTAVTALGNLGISINELAGLSSSQQFQQIARAIAGIDNPARRTAAAVAVFGEEGAKLLPVFQELAQNLRRSESFFDGFTNRLSRIDAGRVEEINNAFSETRTAAQQTAGLILSRLQPALTTAARAVTEFLQGLNIDAVARQASEALNRLSDAGLLVARIAGVVLKAPLFAIGVSMAYLNRQAIQFTVIGLPRTFLAAATAAKTFSVAAGAAAVAANVAKSAFRGLLLATGVGAVGLLFSYAAEAVLNFVGRAEDVEVVTGAAKVVAVEANNAGRQFDKATQSAVRFGKEAKTALQIPTLTAADSAQSAINDARSAVNTLARELGGLANVPAQVLADFSEISVRAQQANEAVFDQKIQLAEVTQAADRFTQQLKAQQELQQANAEAAKRTADEVRKAAEQSQRRTQELAQAGLSGAEQSRIKLNQDLAALAIEQVNAERALAEARRAGDGQAIEAARERLRLVRQGVQVAKEQNRQRQLEALGINRQILDPVKTVRDQIRDVKQAFDDGLLNPDELRNALNNIAGEGLRIRREINDELSRPSAQALRISDVRSGEGLSQFLQAQRRDPALEQRAQQLSTLREIREALRENNIRSAELIG